MEKTLTKNKIIAVLCLLFAISVLAPLSAFAYNRKEARGEVITDGEVKTEYSLNDSFVPAAVKISFNGKQYPATSYIVKYPGGRAYSQSEYVLDESGEYTVVYYAAAENKTVSAELKIKVSDNRYSFTGGNSSARYGADEKGGENGIIVSLAVGEEFVYNKPINLNGKTKADSLLKLYAVPDVVGRAEVKALRIKLTDVCDPDNYVEIYTFGNRWDDNEVKDYPLYSAAAANGQPLTGLHFRYEQTPDTVLYQGQYYVPYKNVSYDMDTGYPSYGFSFVAKGGYGAKPYTLSCNYAEREFYGCKSFAELSNGVIADLDEPLFFYDLWQGFKTGYATLSISADNYVSTSFNFVITDIAGDDLSCTDYKDITAPQIEVNYGEENENNLPKAVVGKPYTIFPATAADTTDGTVPVNAFVYFGNSSAAASIEVKDGKFTPTRTGEYYIVYRTADRSGNVGSVSVKITAKPNDELSLSDLSLAANGITGVEYAITRPEVYGAEGKVKISVRATLAGGETVYEAGERNGEYVFTPLYAGEYEIAVICKDYVGEVVKKANVTVAANQNAVFTEKPVLPAAFVKKVGYKIPALSGYTFGNGKPTVAAAKTYYSFDGGEFAEYTGGDLVIEADEKVFIRYEIDKSVAEFTVPVQNVNYDSDVSRKDYFYSESFSAEGTDDSVVFDALATDGVIRFLNDVLVSDFSVVINFGTLPFGKFVLRLTSVNNDGTSLPIEIKKSESGYALITVNGGKTYTVSSGVIVSDIEINYKNGSDVLSIGENSYSVNGFGGFRNHLAQLSFEITGAEIGSSVLKIKSLNKQILSAQTGDYAAPAYSYEINNGSKRLGDEIVISRFTVQDVLCFKSYAELTVYDPSGNVCTATDGTLMKAVRDFDKEYKIKVDKYGAYSVKGKVYDEFGNSANVSITINAADDVAPTITLSEISATGQVGKFIKIAKATVTDNKDAAGDIKLKIFVTDSNLKTICLSEDGFVATVTGEYIVTYSAVDSDGNYSFATYTISVK